MSSNATGVELPFRARVNYELTRAELQRQFQEGGGATGYFRNDHAFRFGKKLVSAEVCEGINRESRELAFGYLHLGRDASYAEALEEMDQLGLRPAVIEEVAAFDLHFPEEKKKFFIAVLGTNLIYTRHAILTPEVTAFVMRYSNTGKGVLEFGYNANEPKGKWRDHVRFLVTLK